MPSVADVADRGFYVVTADDVIPIGEFPVAERSSGLESLIEQEMFGRRRESVPARLAQLFGGFGFGWEPRSEPGHMRVLEHAAFMLRQARENAARQAAMTFHALNVPCAELDGVSLVDPLNPVLHEYLKLTSSEQGLYGSSPYEVGGGDRSYMLRQTSCFQKFSACLDRRLSAESLPVALFEISDSFRREPEESLQLSYRLRRFHLPEAHIHTAGMRAAVELSQRLHLQILRAVVELEADVVLLISATHQFAIEHPEYFKQLAAQAGCQALLTVAAPGLICEDGVEVDVEYKLVDSLGCCRELSTFQIDDRITRSFGLQCDDGTIPSTIHAVLTGGVERYIFWRSTGSSGVSWRQSGNTCRCGFHP